MRFSTLTFATLLMTMGTALAIAAASDSGRENGIEHRMKCVESALVLIRRF